MDRAILRTPRALLVPMLWASALLPLSGCGRDYGPPGRPPVSGEAERRNSELINSSGGKTSEGVPGTTTP